MELWALVVYFALHDGEHRVVLFDRMTESQCREDKRELAGFLMFPDQKLECELQS